ncbi:hypothetical protein CYLTODRAFT_196282 [Cylindrobasidium torrendii FP15055 ss-10]|uniref:Uncharacterized protein n=1 Tax=Cylindrobasidium torrendii FP15055 ss-10 TaxID=1314674 RepID=A0A0D7BIN2_9AGAR|nr:hypothetical protein CYLTODRAFT_196282 [Cylindrobasidium torrendii FP15055 ss-10]
MHNRPTRPVVQLPMRAWSDPSYQARVPTPAPQLDDAEWPVLGPVRPPSSHSISSSSSMPRLQAVSDSDSGEELMFSETDAGSSDDDDDSSGTDDEMPALQAIDNSDDDSDDATGRNTGGEQSLPPFVTDGRGRVIGATPEPLPDESENGPARRGLLDRMFGNLF